MPGNRRLGAENAKSRNQLIEAADQLISDEGYHAVSARRVAERAGLKPQLVHYYFETMDDLIVAAFQRANDQYLELLDHALSSPQPLRALWKLNTDRPDTKRTMEFIAFATHREAMRAQIVRAGERTRSLQIAAVSRVLQERGIDASVFPAAAFVMLMAAISRAFVLEASMGMSLAHGELAGLVDRLLDQIEP